MKSLRILSFILGIILILSSFSGTMIPLDWIDYGRKIIVEKSEGVRENFCFCINTSSIY